MGVYRFILMECMHGVAAPQLFLIWQAGFFILKMGSSVSLIIIEILFFVCLLVGWLGFFFRVLLLFLFHNSPLKCVNKCSCQVVNHLKVVGEKDW